jgi:putative ABC transport system substrate-binding protein
LKRREFIAFFGSTAACLTSLRARAAEKRASIAVVSGASQAMGWRYVSGFAQGMSELGYIEGKTLDTTYRYADGDLRRLPGIVAELVRANPDILLMGSPAAAVAARQATQNIPIVGVALLDPIGFGLIASDARPGGNVTGVRIEVPGLAGKRVQIALEAMARAAKLGVIVNVTNASNPIQLREAVAAARPLNVTIVPVEIRSGAEIEGAFRVFARERVDAVLVPTDSIFLAERDRIAQLALAVRLASVYGYREHVEAGGLISYGVHLRENYRRGAYFADKILKGVRPADLPVEFPTKLELVVNLKTAKALGLTMSDALLYRADEAIE